jgi:hypothetical protein
MKLGILTAEVMSPVQPLHQGNGHPVDRRRSRGGGNWRGWLGLLSYNPDNHDDQSEWVLPSPKSTVRTSIAGHAHTLAPTRGEWESCRFTGFSARPVRR